MTNETFEVSSTVGVNYTGINMENEKSKRHEEVAAYAGKNGDVYSSGGEEEITYSDDMERNGFGGEVSERMSGDTMVTPDNMDYIGNIERKKTESSEDEANKKIERRNMTPIIEEQVDDSRGDSVEKPPSPVPDTETPGDGNAPMISAFANARGPSPVPEAATAEGQDSANRNLSKEDASEEEEYGLVGNRTTVQLHQMPSTDTSRQHHLLRHSLPSDQRGQNVLFHFGVETISEAAKLIKKMSQRDLQAKFKAVYGARTFSNNNNWLRRKLFEAIGLDPSKGAVKKAGTGGTQRRRRQSVKASPKPPSGPRSVRRARGDFSMMEDNHNAAEALLALGELAGLAAAGYDLDDIETHKHVIKKEGSVKEIAKIAVVPDQKQEETQESSQAAGQLNSDGFQIDASQQGAMDNMHQAWQNIVAQSHMPVPDQIQNEGKHDAIQTQNAVAAMLEWIGNMQSQALALQAHVQQSGVQISPQFMAMVQMQMQMQIQMQMAALAQTNPAAAAQLMQAMAMAQQMQVSASALNLGMDQSSLVDAYQRMIMEGMQAMDPSDIYQHYQQAAYEHTNADDSKQSVEVDVRNSSGDASDGLLMEKQQVHVQ